MSIKSGIEKRNRMLREYHRGIMDVYPNKLNNPLEVQLQRYKKHMEVNKKWKEKKY